MSESILDRRDFPDFALGELEKFQREFGKANRDKQNEVMAALLPQLLEWKRGYKVARYESFADFALEWAGKHASDNPKVTPPEVWRNLQLVRLLGFKNNLLDFENMLHNELLHLGEEDRDFYLTRLEELKERFYPHQQKNYVARLDKVRRTLKDYDPESGETPDNWFELYRSAAAASKKFRVPPFAKKDVPRLIREVTEYQLEGERSAHDYNLYTLMRQQLPALEQLARQTDDLADHAVIVNFLGEIGEFPAFYTSSRLRNIVAELQEANLISNATIACINRASQYNSRLAKDFAFLSLPPLNGGEPWADALLDHITTLPQPKREAWAELLHHARTASAGKPSAKWLKTAAPLLDSVGKAEFAAALEEALPLLSRKRTADVKMNTWQPVSEWTIDEYNALALKGLLWLVPETGSNDLTRLLAGVVNAALKKVAGIGPRDVKVANAAVYALSQIESEAALSALARLSTSVKFKGTLNQIKKALGVVAERLGVTEGDLLDMSVPDFGLQLAGRGAEKTEQWGDYTARLAVDAGGAGLSFSKADKTLKSVPAPVKRDHADELKEWKAQVKEIGPLLSSIGARLDTRMISQEAWQGETWLKRYLHHPLTGTVARRLIWVVDGVACFYQDNMMYSLEDIPVLIMDDSEVRLWHPLGRNVDEALEWRDRLDTLGVRQPFKQAWREVYLLTDAERRTEVYSNRFAGHVLKQHQFNQLAALRGWRNQLRLMVDDSYPPARRELPEYGLRAEYWIEGIGENYGEDSTESGTYLRVSTDQLRFYPIDAPHNHAHAGGGGYEMWVSQEQRPTQPVPLEDVPPLVLSEVMRDVDLFVGVASVGNDPTWEDGGPQGHFREYWQSYSFGELNETAKTRAAYLERLIPRLKIAEQLSLDGRFLKVEGERRTYKIHLRSANILMEPNDEYLCIIPGGKNSGPDIDFDGDRVLSMILSKAFLLAADTKIKDPVILQQLGRRG